MLMILGALLFLGGMLEYLVMAYVHSSYGQWRLPGGEQILADPSSHPGGQQYPKPSLSGIQGDALYRRYLESIGKENMLALQAQIPGASIGGQDDSSQLHAKEDFKFYEQRDDLLRNIDRKIARLGKLHSQLSTSKMDNSAANLNADANKDESDYGGSRHIDNRFRYIHFDQEWGKREEVITESPYGPEILLENDTSLVSRDLSPDEAAGNDILLTLRTIKKYHNGRLPLLFDTWLSKVNKSNVFLMTDGRDSTWQKRVWKDGML